MKLSILSYITIGAGLIQVGASPLRVIVVSSGSQEISSNLRYGHPVPHFTNDVPHAMIADGTDSGNPERHWVNKSKSRRPCTGVSRGDRLHQKAVELSNTFRQALGLPLIETDGDKTYQILPITRPPVAYNESGTVSRGGDHHHHHAHSHHRHHHARYDSFMRRLHVALMALGTWEGRAVAFVLGCGIGVLLRMIWVLAVISYRTIRGEREQEMPEYTHVFVEHYEDDEDAEIIVAPPTYTYVDEKNDNVVVPVVVKATNEESN